jgi:HECT-domain (ubiquitin-transferase)
MKELLSQNLGLFSVASTPEFSYKVNEDSKHIDNHRTLFLFFGEILAKALFDNIPVNVCLNKSIFKVLLGFDKEHEYSNLEDFKSVDYNVRNNNSYSL